MNENLDDFVNEATGQNADGSSLTGEQLFAIRKAGELGKRLQEDFPEIADEYRNGMTLAKISLEYCIQELYDARTSGIARSAVRDALVGYDFDGISYLGLIEDPEERRNIGLEHHRESGKTLYEMGKGIHGRTAEQMSEHGKALYEMRKGIHGRTAEQRTEHSKTLYEMRKGIHGRTAEQMSEHGRKGGEAAYEMGKGVHGRTAEQMSEHGRKGGEAAYEMGKGIHGMTTEQRSENSRKNVMARGFVPWVPAEETNEHYRFSEVETAFKLSQCPEYRRGTLVKGAKIADELNTLFHDGEPVRSATAVSAQLSIYRRETGEV